MAIEQRIWKLAGTTGELPQKLRPTGLADEMKLSASCTGRPFSEWSTIRPAHSASLNHRGSRAASLPYRCVARSPTGR